MDCEDAGNNDMHLTEQDLFRITEEMRSEMVEVYKKASQIPEKYIVDEDIPYNFRTYTNKCKAFLLQ